MANYILELFAGEGGLDAKLLVIEQYNIYKKLEARRVL